MNVKLLKEVKTLLNTNKIIKIKVAAVVASFLNSFFLLLEISVGDRKVTVCIVDHSMHHLAGIQDCTLHIASEQ